MLPESPLIFGLATTARSSAPAISSAIDFIGETEWAGIADRRLITGPSRADIVLRPFLTARRRELHAKQAAGGHDLLANSLPALVQTVSR